MAATPIGVTWIWLLMMGGLGMVPVGPPLPLDPVLSAIAPQECLWYATSAGAGAPDSASANHTEQLYAEPAVQRFFTELESQIMTAVRQSAGDAPDKKVLLAKVPIVLKAVLSRPTAMYLEDVQPRGDGTGVVEAAFVLNAGDQREELVAAQTSLLTLATASGTQTTTETLAGVEWQRLALPPEAPPVRLGWNDDYFLLAVGEETPARLLERMRGRAPQWLTQIRAEHPIERERAVGYLNVASILQAVKPFADAEDPNIWPTLEKLGLLDIRSVHGVTGFDAEGCASVAHVVTGGGRRGLLGFLPHEPLEASDLAPVPKDATFALAWRLNPAEALEEGVALAGQFDPNAQANVDAGVAAIKAQLGVDAKADIVEALGDGWVIYLPGGDLMTSWLNAGAAVGVKDAAKLRPAAERLIQILEMQAAQGGGAAINESTVGDHKIYTLQIQGAPIPVSPSWCIADNWVHFGLSSQAVQAAIARKAEDSLAAAEPVAAALASDHQPAGLAYQDTPQLVRSLYPMLQMGLMMASTELQRQGIRIDPSIMPPMETIVKHVRPSVATFAHVEDGFQITSRGTLPGGGNLASAAPVGVALLLPAVQASRQAARRNSELNNLKIMALATHNYLDANGSLPTDIYGDDGKPLLKLRVRLLPYMEHQALYQRFKLDEPWDSENNRPLLDQMPDYFKTPTADLGAKTRYLALKGEGTLFPGNQKLKLQHVTDGTSNTILFVQANPDAAVEWTKPADIEFNADQPFAGVAAPEGHFPTAFCDGSARLLSLAIGGEGMKAYASMAGDEPVDWQGLPSAPELYDPSDPDGVLEPADAAVPAQ